MEKQMPQITFVQWDQSSVVVDAKEGHTLMLTALLNDVSGIVGECGGCCVCGTCHIVCSPEDFARLGTIGGEEEAVLDSLFNRTRTSRLACQIEVAAALDGLVVHVATEGQ